MLWEQKTMSAINNQFQVPCIHAIRDEQSSVANLQEGPNDNVILKKVSTCSCTDKTYCSQMSFVQHENSSDQSGITPDLAIHIQQSTWKRGSYWTGVQLSRGLFFWNWGSSLSRIQWHITRARWIHRDHRNSLIFFKQQILIFVTVLMCTVCKAAFRLPA